uniref:Immunoglobulin subtype domain-containing protein n=1 Tax=Amphilophus citrinellus TaxID=61819 RepID=A0A3Q0QXY5_AMPCI
RRKSKSAKLLYFNNTMKGGSVSIPCYYEPLYQNHVKYLCKGYFWVSCSAVIKTNQLKTSEKFSISDDTNQRIFTVTINDLTYFWLSVKKCIKCISFFFFQGMKSLTVSQQEIAAFEGGSVTAVCRYKYPKEKGVMWCRLGSICVTSRVGSIDGTTVKINMSVPNIFTVTMSDLRTESSGWYWGAVGDLQIPVHIIVHKVTSATTTALHPNTSKILA